MRLCSFFWVLAWGTKSLPYLSTSSTVNSKRKIREKMAFWRQIKQSHVGAVSIHLRRSYFRIHTPYAVNDNLFSRLRILASDSPALSTQRTRFQLPTINARFFAAPAQSLKKKEDRTSGGPRLNEDISADIVRVVTDTGHSIMSRQRALGLAKSLDLDLVEVQQTAKPPVCKIMDYYKEKYKQELKEKDRVKSKMGTKLRSGSVKEVRFTGKITQKDLQIKADMVKRLMERGHRVKCLAAGTSKQTGKGEDSTTLLSRFFSLIEDVSVVEIDGRVEDKDQAHMIVRHIKYGPLKKGSGKKEAGDKNLSSVQSEGIVDGDPEGEEARWDVSDDDGEIEEIFKLEHHQINANGTPELDSTIKQKASSPTPAGQENRYLKDSRHRSQPMDGRTSSHSQFPDTGRWSQVNANPSFQQRGGEYIDKGFPPARNSMFVDQDLRSTDTYRQADNTQGSSQTVVNRYKQMKPANPARDLGRGGIVGRPNSPFPNARSSREQGVDKDNQGKWGIFSAEGPGRKLEDQVKVQR